MKYSADYGDRGTVYLDGEPLADCVECDTEAGTVVVVRRNELGNIVFNHALNKVETEVRRGNVAFVRYVPTA